MYRRSHWVQQRSKLPSLPKILSTDAPLLYAVTAGGIIAIVILTRLISRLNCIGVDLNTSAFSSKNVSSFEIFSHECHLFRAIHLKYFMNMTLYA